MINLVLGFARRRILVCGGNLSTAPARRSQTRAGPQPTELRHQLRAVRHRQARTRACRPSCATRRPSLEKSAPFVDPLPQALILTAIVISFGVTAFVVVLLNQRNALVEEHATEEPGRPLQPSTIPSPTRATTSPDWTATPTTTNGSNPDRSPQRRRTASPSGRAPKLGKTRLMQLDPTILAAPIAIPLIFAALGLPFVRWGWDRAGQVAARSGRRRRTRQPGGRRHAARLHAAAAIASSC